MTKAWGALVCLNAAALAYAENRPRGVSPEFAKHYKDPSTFTCISDPAVQLPFARVNDDYCDCPDGSDEPGTSACSHLSSYSPQTPSNANLTHALPGFYCKNKGHIPAYVPFTNVNDGVCDYELCCDGSEEWDGVGGVKCADRCQEIGKDWRKLGEARQKSLGNAGRKRKEMVLQAGRMRKEVEDRIWSLRTEIEGAEVKVRNLEAELKEVERREKGKVAKGPAGGGKMGVLVGLAKERMEELREGLVRVREERDEVKERVKELEGILTTFKEEYNPNFNDEGVKRAVRAWEEYAARDHTFEEDEPAVERDFDEMVKSDKENGLDWEEYEGGEEGSDTDVLYAFENYLPPTIRTWLDTRLRDLRVTLIDSGILADTSSFSTTESKAVTDARNRFNTAERELTNSRNDLQSRKDDLEKDFGPDDIFRALKGTCVSTDSGEYTYELCFMEKTTQKPKKGGGHTNMGNYVRMERIMVDEDLPANGKGLGSGERIAMKHENGQHCWNGPNRSSTIVLACAEENEIWKIMEEEKCVYRLEVGTPAVCETQAGGKKEEVKDEL
ncbi:uncharacterized protein LTR77_005503 [Saxophila tyrrhenica]|uniref:Glucosidase 2 subunit beta n=1 Tax=Saxophila tyrrhenica TaxID=1690608 RepID=A0AAV9P996_9PEZI|nr:hypothetical protein LTR77_005503 [Saxophila tyrrhenica]